MTAQVFSLPNHSMQAAIPILTWSIAKALQPPDRPALPPLGKNTTQWLLPPQCNRTSLQRRPVPAYIQPWWQTFGGRRTFALQAMHENEDSVAHSGVRITPYPTIMIGGNGRPDPGAYRVYLVTCAYIFEAAPSGNSRAKSQGNCIQNPPETWLADMACRSTQTHMP